MRPDKLQLAILMKTLAKWSVDDYHRMIAAGILHGRSVELLGGEIVEMSPETPLHYSTAKRGARYLEQLLAGKADVRFNGPITLENSEPSPDIAIVRFSESEYSDRHPHPSDIYWVIEVANTSLRIDRDIKAGIYATAGIAEYWIVDLAAKRLIVLRHTQAGQYTEQLVLQEGAIAPLQFETIPISVPLLLG